jgi:hypothetical protein
MESVNAIVDFVKQRPFVALGVTHAITTGAFVYAISEGHPLRWITKKLFQAALAAVPASVVDAERDKLRKSIEKSVIGHSLDGEELFNELPEEGASRRPFSPKWAARARAARGADLRQHARLRADLEALWDGNRISRKGKRLFAPRRSADD